MLFGINTTFAQKYYPLSEGLFYELEVGKRGRTTIHFPSSLSSIEGINVFDESEDSEHGYIFKYQEGDNYFSIIATERTGYGSLNVVHGNSSYQISLWAGDDVYEDVYFYDDYEDAISLKPSKLSPNDLVEMLDIVKHYELVNQQYPGYYQDIETRYINTTTDYKGFNVAVIRAFKFKSSDTIVLKLRFSSFSNETFYYKPHQIGIRIGDKIFYPSITDVEGVIRPEKENLGYIAVTGTPEGGKAHISLKNDFKVILSKLEHVSILEEMDENN